MGRKVEPNALTRTGIAHAFVLSQKDEARLRGLLDLNEVGLTELVRRFVRQADIMFPKEQPTSPQMDE